MKKIGSALLLFLLGLTLTACKEEMTILYDGTTSITIKETETLDISELDITTNDPLGLLYGSSDNDVFSVSETGVITGVSAGEGILTIKSRTNPSVMIDIDVTVRKLITITSEITELILTENDVFSVVVSSNDDVVYASSNLDVFVVDETGEITAKSMGNATLTVTSTYDDSVQYTIAVTVEKLVVITVPTTDYVMVVGDEKALDFSSNDDVTLESRNPNIVSIDEDGIMTALQFGTATIRIISVTNPEVIHEVEVTVFKFTTGIEIEGDQLLIVGMSGQLSINASPVGAFDEVLWSSLDETIVSVDEFGVVTGEQVGNVQVMATSVLDDTVVAVYDIEVINVSVVDGTATTGSTYNYLGVELIYGERLFATIEAALTASPEGTLIYIDNGTFTNNLTIDQDGITIEGINNVIIEGTITIAANNVTLRNLAFTGNAQIVNTGDIEGFVFEDNSVYDSTLLSGSFIHISGIQTISIQNNTFSDLPIDAIVLEDFIDGEIVVNFNTFNNVQRAIVIDAVREYAITSEFHIWWNTVDSATTAITVDLLYGSDEQKAIEAIVRFNTISNYTLAVVSNVGNSVDFTLNYWGTEIIDELDFVNVDPYYIRGFYTSSEQVLTQANYNPAYPILITILNPIDEIMIGETHTFTYDILPMELSDHPMKFITGNPDLVHINQSGMITPLKSGEVIITVRSAINSSIKTTDAFLIVTTPGIELTPSNIMNDVIVGDSFTLTAEPFPVNYSSEAVSFSSSDESVATIDASGVVTTHSEGLVTFTASLVSDSLVTQTYTMYVYSALDPNNLLDYLTLNQVNYTTSHEWIAYGFAYNYNDRRYESVSRYYFDNIEINTSKMVPVFYAIRPGAPMDELPPGVIPYNPENVHWIVIHDTASTATGSGALAHANYLYNSTLSSTELWVSWHFTIDDTYVYQHLPTNERGFHAGDGSTGPGEGSYTGGGNRNGIGIEMAVNEDGDMFRTWQRTAKLAVDLMLEYNLPITQQKFHNDFSGKDCPNTLRNAGLVPLFKKFVEVEYNVASLYPGAMITFHSNNPDYLDDHGRIISLPDRALTVSYTITVTYNNVTESRTFYSYLPGTVR